MDFMAATDPYLDTLSLLNKIGPTLRHELIGLVPGCNLPLLLQLESDGRIARHNGDPDVVSITKSGQRQIGATGVKAKARKETWTPSDDSYNGADLKPFTGRPGCNAALELPSRHFNELHYRDGKVVNL